ncbi:sulfurtransferase-like selenium metabolism protein YedF [Shewanella marina]|uniref:sulfurtransferase-like selenium metabolism protein YedF n=1 Tax=Shewanella marina TaxID=487319 RepID=UPI000470B232|nr:sulfurtransferase-like selenium metabolism protein YedF [Shewanella marina]
MTQTTEIIADYQLDMTGESCPYPSVATLETMLTLETGEVLEVLSDCAQSIHNIPADIKNFGYQLLNIIQEGSDIRFYIRK